MTPRRSFSLLALLVCASAPAAQESKPSSSKEDRELIKMAEEIEKEVEELRGWKFKHAVKKGVYTEEKLRDYIEKKLFEEEYGGGKLERVESFLRIVGLIPKDCELKKTMVDVLLNQIGGFYDPDTKSFYMMKRTGIDYGPLLTRVLIAHELTHALDDQHVDLDRLMKSRERTEDWGLAIGSVAEGSATSLMTVYMARLMKSGKYNMEQIQDVAKAEAERGKAFFEAPPYFATIAATYMCGLQFLNRGASMMEAMVGGGAQDEVGDEVLAAAKDPPRSMEQILHPDKYWESKKRDEPVVVDDKAMEKTLEVTPGWRVVHKDTVGELLCAVLTNPKNRKVNPQLMANPSYWTNTAAKGWGGDRFFLLAAVKDAEPTGAALADRRGAWITAWDTAKDADEFVGAYEQRLPDPARVTVRVGERMVAFLFGFQEREADALARTLRESPPPATRDGEVWSGRSK